jgi:hypothetical protein
VTRLRRHRSVLLAVFCTLGAVVAVLIAVDAHAWETTVARDDLRFRALPAHRGLWTPPTLLPGDPASELIGTGSTTQYRLQTLISTAPNSSERSAAANLLGVLVVTAPALDSDKNAVKQILVRAREYFQQAIALDPANIDAKQNLELVLRLQRPGKGKLGNDARRGIGFGRGRAAGVAGSGY